MEKMKDDDSILNFFPLGDSDFTLFSRKSFEKLIVTGTNFNKKKTEATNASTESINKFNDTTMDFSITSKLKNQEKNSGTATCVTAQPVTMLDNNVNLNSIGATNLFNSSKLSDASDQQLPCKEVENYFPEYSMQPLDRYVVEKAVPLKPETIKNEINFLTVASSHLPTKKLRTSRSFTLNGEHDRFQERRLRHRGSCPTLPKSSSTVDDEIQGYSNENRFGTSNSKKKELTIFEFLRNSSFSSEEEDIFKNPPREEQFHSFSRSSLFSKSVRKLTTSLNQASSLRNFDSNTLITSKRKLSENSNSTSIDKISEINREFLHSTEPLLTKSATVGTLQKKKSRGILSGLFTRSKSNTDISANVTTNVKSIQTIEMRAKNCNDSYGTISSTPKKKSSIQSQTIVETLTNEEKENNLKISSNSNDDLIISTKKKNQKLINLPEKLNEDSSTAKFFFHLSKYDKRFGKVFEAKLDRSVINQIRNNSGTLTKISSPVKGFLPNSKEEITFKRNASLYKPAQVNSKTQTYEFEKTSQHIQTSQPVSVATQTANGTGEKANPVEVLEFTPCLKKTEIKNAVVELLKKKDIGNFKEINLPDEIISSSLDEFNSTEDRLIEAKSVENNELTEYNEISSSIDSFDSGFTSPKLENSNIICSKQNDMNLCNVPPSEKVENFINERHSRLKNNNQIDLFEKKQQTWETIYSEEMKQEIEKKFIKERNLNLQLLHELKNLKNLYYQEKKLKEKYFFEMETFKYRYENLAKLTYFKLTEEIEHRLNIEIELNEKK
ncbi:hypothetical protein HDU92_002585 [Lobulomyces angularis]|nr:hypothetical protein HDU92_002585 [Lobulomyces angularis]